MESDKVQKRRVPSAKKSITCGCEAKGLPQGSCHKKIRKSYPSRKGQVPAHLKSFLFKKKSTSK